MFDSDITKHLAELSKIEFSEEELIEMTSDMENIIRLMDKVKDFDSNSEPYALDAVDFNSLRKDFHDDSYNTNDLLSNAKITKNKCFVVPKVI